MLKAFTFIATACLLATTAGARELAPLQFQQHADLNGIRATFAKAPAKAAGETDYISEAEGEAKNYTKTFDVNYMGYVMEQQSAVSTIVFGSDNTVYFADPMSLLPTGTYIKGTIEGNKISVAYPQCIFATEDEGAYEYTLVEPLDEMDEETGLQMAKIMEPGTATYTIGDDGVITLDPLPENCGFGIIMAGSMYLGICEFNISFSADSREAVTPPAGLETTTYSYKMNDFYGHPAQIGFDGNDVYFTNISTDVPDLWFKGTIEADGKIHIANRQFMGTYMGAYEIYTFLARETEEYPYMEPAEAEAEYTFDFDPETGKIYNGSSDLILLINAGAEDIVFLCRISPNGFWLQENYAGTPQDPYNLEWAEGTSFNTLDFYLPNVDTDGNLMLNENLYYNLFYDGEVVEINPEEFGSDSFFTDIPFDYNKNMIVRDRIDGAHEIGVKVWGLETIGLQLINKCDGVEHRSRIVELNLENGIVTGVDNVATGKSPVVSTEYFDLTGRRIANNAKGFCIQRRHHADGTVSTVKALR